MVKLSSNHREMYNPSLVKESRYEPAAVIPLKQDTSLIGVACCVSDRLILREAEQSNVIETEDAEISDLIDGDDDPLYDDDDEADED